MERFKKYFVFRTFCQPTGDLYSVSCRILQNKVETIKKLIQNTETWDLLKVYIIKKKVCSCVKSGRNFCVNYRDRRTGVSDKKRLS